jgi:hypothetical protein
MIIVIGLDGQSWASASARGKAINAAATNDLNQWSGIMRMGFSFLSLK